MLRDADVWQWRPLAAAAMPRRVEVLRRLASAGLPFQVPQPLTPVPMFGDRAAVAVSWIDGAALPEGVGSIAQIAEVLEAMGAVSLDGALLAALEGRPESRHWSETITADIVPRLPARWRRQRPPRTPVRPEPNGRPGCPNTRSR